ncbi:putative integrase [Cronobacter phage EspYZU12]|nr:putative integrase [Cronobacter phage EspYZU15]WAK45641.1 putative integrase [Cronobacter phage EspYZU14]WBF78425.1 putative integrase [Cronobacter phage EspYZU12]
MQQPTPKFKIGDVVRDNNTGKVCPISALYWSEGDEHNQPEWAYSLDSLGWLFIGESDLEAVNGTT